jgi:peroxiredoxin Q/BCP
VTPSLTAGDPAPPFSLPLAQGGQIRLQDFSGERAIIFFYPKDDTSGCTIEAREFSAMLDDFRAAGVRLLGISRDSPATHRRFSEKHALSVDLASDEAGEACHAYGVWVEKSLYGRRYMGIERSTFLIGADGRIAHVWRKVRPAGHAAAALELCLRA